MASHVDFKIDGIEMYMAEDFGKKNADKFKDIEKRIREGLKDSNLSKVTFWDVHGDGIQVNLMHKKMQSYVYVIAKLNRDFSNIDEVVEEAIRHFKQKDTPEGFKAYSDFISDGLKYGWD